MKRASRRDPQSPYADSRLVSQAFHGLQCLHRENDFFTVLSDFSTMEKNKREPYTLYSSRVYSKRDEMMETLFFFPVNPREIDDRNFSNSLNGCFIIRGNRAVN